MVAVCISVLSLLFAVVIVASLVLVLRDSDIDCDEDHPSNPNANYYLLLVNLTISAVTICIYLLVVIIVSWWSFIQFDHIVTTDDQHGHTNCESMRQTELHSPCEHIIGGQIGPENANETVDLMDGEHPTELQSENDKIRILSVIAFIVASTSLSLTCWGVYDAITAYGCVSSSPAFRFLIFVTVVQLITLFISILSLSSISLN